MVLLEGRPVALQDEIDEMVLELGLAFVERIETKEGPILRFRIVDRDRTRKSFADPIAHELRELLITSPYPEVVKTAQDAKGFTVD
jgi:hypothetical protein